MDPPGINTQGTVVASGGCSMIWSGNQGVVITGGPNGEQIRQIVGREEFDQLQAEQLSRFAQMRKPRLERK